MADIAERLGKPLMPWQRHVVDVAMELDERGRLVYQEVDLTVPRQSGKTALVMAKTVHRLSRMVLSHGPQRSTYTAQTRLKARSKFEKDFAEVLRSSASFRELLNPRARPSSQAEWKLSLNNGSENFQFGRASHWQLDAPSRTTGHGDTLDDGTIDEAFAHATDDIEAGMRPSMATRRDRQIWVLSTAGDERSFYLYRKVLAGRAACASGNHGSVAYFEWSAPDDADPGDPDVWRACSPALGITIDEDFLFAEWSTAQRKGQEGIDTFRRAYLNQWPTVPILDSEERWVIPKARWLASERDDSEIEGQEHFALEVAEDYSWAAFAAAGTSTLGGVHAEVIDYRRGTDWVVARAAELSERWGVPIAVCRSSPAASLIDDLRAAEVDVAEMTTEDHARACGRVENLIANHQFWHLDQPALTVSVRSAVKRQYGDAWVWSRRKSTVDISPLVAVTLAVGAMGVAPDEKAAPFVLIIGGD